LKYHGVELNKMGNGEWTAFRNGRELWIARVTLTQFANLAVADTVQLRLGWPLITWGVEVIEHQK